MTPSLGVASRLCGNRRGAVAIIVALALVPILGFVALIFDIGSARVAEQHLQTAADGAALAAVKALREGGSASAVAIEYARKNASVDDYGEVLATNDVVTGNWTEGRTPAFIAGGQPANAVRVTTRQAAANGNAIETMFGKVLGSDEVNVSAEAIAVYAPQAEVALVLDVTGSMAGTKIEDLRQAARDILDVLFGDQPTVEGLEVAIVPFAPRVNIGTAHADWLQTPPSASWAGCVESRSGSYATSDDPPSVRKFTPTPETYRSRRREYPIPCPHSLLPLTATKSDLVTYVNTNLVPDGGTRIDMGLRWGWRVISPRWQGLWGDAETPKPAESRLVKSVVLMTDGQNDTGSYDEVNESEADANVTSLCNTMKQQGIVIYTVMFSAPASVRTLFSTCASKPEYFFETHTATQLRDAFKNIGGLINKPKLVH